MNLTEDQKDALTASIKYFESLENLARQNARFYAYDPEQVKKSQEAGDQAQHRATALKELLKDT